MDEEIKWTCHVCGAVRGDSFIAVAQHDLSVELNLSPGTTRLNIRYCSDSRLCQLLAEQVGTEDFERCLKRVRAFRRPFFKKAHGQDT